MAWYGKAITKKIMADMKPRLEKAAIHLTNQLKLKITTGTRSGVVYMVKGKPHIASAAGEPPAVSSGVLRNSIGYEIVTPYLARVGVSSTSAAGVTGEESKGYSRRLEYGFIGVDRLGRHYDMAPRPFLRPTLDENRKKIGQILAGK